jgi:hypothetical protein
MEMQSIDRRKTLSMAETMPGNPHSANIVLKGMTIQARLGTISAVEYLKVHDIGSTVIQRVLTSECVRAEDRDVLNEGFIDEHFRA